MSGQPRLSQLTSQNECTLVSYPNGRENEFSVANGFRILSAYTLSTGTRMDGHRSRPHHHNIASAVGLLMAAGTLLSCLFFMPELINIRVPPMWQDALTALAAGHDDFRLR